MEIQAAFTLDQASPLIGLNKVLDTLSGGQELQMSELLSMMVEDLDLLAELIQDGPHQKDYGLKLRRMRELLGQSEALKITESRIVFHGAEITRQIEQIFSSAQKNRKEEAARYLGETLNRMYMRTERAISSALLQDLRRDNMTWSAGLHSQFADMTLEEFVQTKLGARKPSKPANSTRKAGNGIVRDIPPTFDWRTSNLSACIHPIMDQGNCGSCWAFGGAETLSYRFCVQTNGQLNVLLSPQYLVTCDGKNFGCNGGYLDTEWAFMEEQGLPTLKCVPYVSGDGFTTPNCYNYTRCVDGSEKLLYYAARGSSQAFDERSDQQTDIMTNGPIETWMNVYQDFLSYTGGVYQHTTGPYLGGHMVKVLGWGNANGVDYWIAANQWGTLWGDEGYFNIKMGDSDFDDSMWGGLIDLQRSGQPNL
jgi:cathepsin B